MIITDYYLVSIVKVLGWSSHGEICNMDYMTEWLNVKIKTMTNTREIVNRQAE